MEFASDWDNELKMICKRESQRSSTVVRAPMDHQHHRYVGVWPSSPRRQSSTRWLRCVAHHKQTESASAGWLVVQATWTSFPLSAYLHYLVITVCPISESLSERAQTHNTRVDLTWRGEGLEKRLTVRFGSLISVLESNTHPLPPFP